MPTAEAASGTIGRAPPEVSIVIPTRNRPEYLARSLVAALQQRYVRFEVVVVDDGSGIPVASQLTPEAERVRVIRNESTSDPPVEDLFAGKRPDIPATAPHIKAQPQEQKDIAQTALVVDGDDPESE